MADSLSNRILGAITSNPVGASLVGKAGKAIDVVGKALGNPLPEMGVSQKLESAGGAAQYAMASTPQAKQAVEDKAKARTGTNSANAITLNAVNNPAPTNSGQQLSTDQLIQAYKDRGWTDTNAIMGDIAGGGYKSWNLGGGDGGAAAAPVYNTRDVISANPDMSKYLGENDINDLIKEYGEQVTGSTDSLAAAIEKRATDAAEREYQGILSILGTQKEEVGTTAAKQRESTQAQKELTQKELGARQETETTAIEKQKTGFEEEKTKTVETLARNWRDMSLEMQRVARGRGISDSSFAAGKETDLLLNFNQGLRQISTQSLAALQDFSDAVSETTKFYQRQNAQLDLDSKNNMDEIDAWERGQIANINAQQTMAYNKKLSAIENAMTQADTLRVNTANSISEKKMAWGLWLVQQDYAYKQAVAIAAQGKVSDAVSGINKVRDLAVQYNDLVTKGGYEITMQNGKPYLHGQVNGQDDWIPVTESQATNLQTNQTKYQTYTDPITGLPTNMNPTATTTTPKSSGNSILDAIKSTLGI